MKKTLFIISLLISFTAFSQFDENIHYTTIDKSSIGTGDQVYILPALSQTYEDEQILIKNNGTGVFLIDAFGLETIDEDLTITLDNDNDSVLLIKDVNNSNNWNVISTSQMTLNRFYSYIPIWAEESGSLSNNNNQWSYGNGAVGVIGITMMQSEVYAMSLDADISGTNVSIDLVVNGSSVATSLFVGPSGFVVLTNPIQLQDGDVLGFKTNTENGNYTDVRVTAWCRIEYEGIKGDKGDPGEPGQTGIPSQIMRVTINEQTNVNSTTPIDVLFNSDTINTITGSSLGPTTISVPQGKYFVTFRRGFDGTGGQRTSIGLNFMRNGILYSSARSSNYIRTVGGHNFAGDQYSEIYDFSTGGGNIGFQSVREEESTVGNATILEGDTSIVLIQKLSN